MCGTRGSGMVLDMWSVFGLLWCRWCNRGVGRGLDQGLKGWGLVMYVSAVSPDFLCRWQVQVSV